MNVVVNIDGVEYLPLRGAVVLSHEYLSISLLAEYLYDNALTTSNQERRLDAFDPNRDMVQVSPHTFRALAMRTHILRKASSLDQMQALPPGFLIRMSQFQAHVTDRITVEAMQYSSDGRIVIGDNALPAVLEPALSVMKEGLSSFFDARPPAPLPSNHDLDLQERADKLAAAVKEKTKQWPTKTWVAGELSREDGHDAQTIERRIRKTWNRR